MEILVCRQQETAPRRNRVKDSACVTPRRHEAGALLSVLPSKMRRNRGVHRLLRALANGASGAA